jgi:hypothetical protein
LEGEFRSLLTDLRRRSRMTTNSVYGNVEAYMSRSDLEPLLAGLRKVLGVGAQVTTEEYAERRHSVSFSLLTGEDIDQAAVMDAVRAITEGGVSRGIVYFVDLRDMQKNDAPDIALFDLSRSSDPVVEGTWFGVSAQAEDFLDPDYSIVHYSEMP